MASIINSTTTAGVTVTGDNSGSLQLATNNGTTAVTINTAQKVGIGTTPSGSYILEVNGNPNFNSVGGVYLTCGTYDVIKNPSGNIIAFGGVTSSQWDTTALYTGGTERMRIDSSGNVMVGTTSLTSGSRFQVKGSTTTDAVACFLFQNSASTTLFAALNSGQFYTGSAAASPYNNTTGSGANVFVASDGLLQRSTSSLKYKTDVIDATHGLTDLLKLRSVTYKGKNDGDTVFGGLIAEEVHDAGLTEFVQYAEDGSPDALSYGNMVSLCVKAIQELKAELDSVKAELQTLKGN